MSPQMLENADVHTLARCAKGDALVRGTYRNPLWLTVLVAALLWSPISEAKPQKGAFAKKAARAEAGQGVLIKDIRFVDDKRSVRVEISLAGKAQHRLVGQNTLELSGVRLPMVLHRVLDTSAFKGPIKQVASFISDAKKQVAQVNVRLWDSSSRGRLYSKGHKLIWEFQKNVVADVNLPGSDTNPADKAAKVTYNYNTQQVAGTRTSGRSKNKRYIGRRIDLDFKDADIHNILRLIADVGNVNVITSDNVKGRVTIRMKNVAWDHALDVILRAKKLGQVREGNLLRVAPLVDLEKEREAELARQKQMMLLQPLETRLIPISYATATDVVEKLRYAMSPRGKLVVDDRTNMIIGRDTASNLDLMEKLIANLDTQTPQVLIEARIIEARHTFQREAGIQWGGNFISSAGTGNPTGLVFPSQIGVGGGAGGGRGVTSSRAGGGTPAATGTASPASGILLGQGGNPGYMVDLPAAAGTGAGSAIGLTLGSITGAVNINLRLSAAEAVGDIRIISAPRIVTLDNEQANIKSGVSIPFSQVSAQGVQTSFKEAVLELKVKPHVTADGSIVLDLNVKRDEPDFVNTGARGDPTILKKEAKTKMLVKDGDTVVIGGIYTTRKGTSYSKVPWLADIPILGYLFKSKRRTTDRTEVLVFITPKIVIDPRATASR